MIITPNISQCEKGEQEREEREEQRRDGKNENSQTQREPHGAHNHLHSGVPENYERLKSESEEADTYLGVFQMQLQQSLQSFASLAVDFTCGWVFYYSPLL